MIWQHAACFQVCQCRNIRASLLEVLEPTRIQKSVDAPSFQVEQSEEHESRQCKPDIRLQVFADRPSRQLFNKGSISELNECHMFYPDPNMKKKNIP